jgi:hypothetical protein
MMGDGNSYMPAKRAREGAQLAPRGGSRPALHSLQTPKIARCRQGVSGPRIGSKYPSATADSNSAGGSTNTGGGSSMAITAGTPAGKPGSGASCCSISTQQLGSCFGSCSHFAQQEVFIALPSSRQMRSGEAASGTSIPRQASRKTAIARRITQKRSLLRAGGSRRYSLYPQLQTG